MNHQLLHRVLARAETNLTNLKKTHGLAITLGLCDNHQSLSCKIFNRYSKLNQTLAAQNVFSTHIGNPDVVSWTSLITHCLHIEHPKEAFFVFSRIVRSGLRPDSYSVVGALSACGRSKDVVNGRVVHGMVFRNKLGASPIVGNALIDMYSRNGEMRVASLVFREMSVKDVSTWTSLMNGFVLCNDLGSARDVFDGMAERNSISWTAMITGYVRGKMPFTALELFWKMTSECESTPTSVTFVAVLSGCADIGAFDMGCSIHGRVSKSNLNADVAVNNALMDMYVKSGNLDLALKIFQDISEKDAFSWTTMVFGLALHGKGNHAVQVFYDMLSSDVVPNDVTYVSVLSACSHAGLVAEGQKIFKKMVECSGFEPKIEHYGCMVDLLGRAGLLNEAKQLIEEMKISPDAVIWRSLLSACLVNRDSALAEVAAKKIIELEPDDDGVYILLWNIYCSEKRWEDALKTRKMMRELNLKKTPGCSWVELEGVVHEFVAEDTAHNAREEIYAVLEGISQQSKLAKHSFQNVCI